MRSAKNVVIFGERCGFFWLFARLIEHKGHSCKTGNVRYGGTSKTQN